MPPRRALDLGLNCSFQAQPTHFLYLIVEPARQRLSHLKLGRESFGDRDPRQYITKGRCFIDAVENLSHDIVAASNVGVTHRISRTSPGSVARNEGDLCLGTSWVTPHAFMADM